MPVTVAMTISVTESELHQVSSVIYNVAGKKHTSQGHSCIIMLLCLAPAGQVISTGTHPFPYKDVRHVLYCSID